MWLHHLPFMDFVGECWATPFVGMPLTVLFLKLKHLRGHLKTWTRDYFGDIHQNVRNAEDGVTRAEFEYETNPTEQALSALRSAWGHLNRVLLQEEIFWKEKSRVKWLKEGERNTRFFHSIVNVKRKRSGICKIKNAQGEWILDKEGVNEEAIKYFSDIFSPGSTTSHEDLLNSIPTIISVEENNLLAVTPGFDEVKEAIFALSKDSALGPDGFTGHFFTACWELVGADVWEAVKDFFEGSYVPRSFTS
ncbi:uncharacterized protein LOC122654841 [Telopea speciosissima]|uniref:uncharacterized protein LOC122654841 n=1 Tax=Telopea speciosissima TaxID=54955 RepID=UPI001CC4C8FC|nr:uncharacterized protein LOC122654841 [Telopea speciosissima]